MTGRCCLTERELAERVTQHTGEKHTAVVMRRLMGGRGDLVESSEHDKIVERCQCTRGGWRLAEHGHELLDGFARIGEHELEAVA